ncbi:MAG: hypothetical protein ACI30J_05425 [Paludibacteraceae bacterium]
MCVFVIAQLLGDGFGDGFKQGFALLGSASGGGGDGGWRCFDDKLHRF